MGNGSFSTELQNDTGEKIAQKGNEFGSTTGRARRCGWIDLPALKYAIDINGVTELSMMKSDVLSGFDKIKVCTGYTYMGQQIEHLPYNLNEHNTQPIYIELKGWHDDISNIKSTEELPKEFKEYILFLETKLNIPISIISVGPDRSQTIFR